MKNKSDNWIIPRARHLPVLWPVITFWNWPVREFVKVKTTGVIIHLWDKGDYLAILQKDTLLEMCEKMLEMLLEKFDDLEKIRTNGLKTGKEVINKCKKFADNAKKAKIEDFISFFDDLEKQYPKIMKENMHYWFLSSQILETKIREELKSHNEEEIKEIFSIMSATKVDSYSKQEEDEFDKIVILARKEGTNSAKVKEKIKKFSEEYFWFPYEYAGPNIWDENAVRKRVEEELSKPLVKKEKQDISNLQKKCIAKYKLSSKALKLFTILQAMTLMQDDRKMINSQVCYYVNGLVIDELTRRLDLAREDALYIDQKLIRLYSKNKNLFRENIKKRSGFFIAVQIDEKLKLYYADEAREYLRSLNIALNQEDQSINEFKGQIAFKGIARGKVRVLKTSHVNDFQDGSVIVTGMTTPDFAQLINRSVAIITDEGGITCHAAIVAREMKKPCIIGTRIATKVLHDGDLVEVDADKGIVKILKKAK